MVISTVLTVSNTMATLPTHVYTQNIPDAGTGLFVSEAIPAGVEVLSIDRPLVAVLDSPHLKDTCSDCFLWLPENGEPQSKRLRACQGCKITKYCCKVGLLFLYAAEYAAQRRIQSYVPVSMSLCPLSRVLPPV